MALSSEVIFTIVSVLLTITIVITTYYMVILQRKRDDARRVQREFEAFEKHMKEELANRNARIEALLHKVPKEETKKTEEDISTIKRISVDTRILAERLQNVETELTKVFRMQEAKKETEEILTRTQHKKLELEVEKMEHDMKIERFGHYPRRTWPKWLATIGVAITTASVSVGSFLYSQGENFIVVLPIVAFSLGVFAYGLYFWARDDRERLSAYRKSFLT